MSHLIATATMQIFDFAHDTSGNPTAHYELRVDGELLRRTRRREQIGYSGTHSSGAMFHLTHFFHALDKKRPFFVMHDPKHVPTDIGRQVHPPALDRSVSNYVHLLVSAVPEAELVDTLEYRQRQVAGLVKKYISRLSYQMQHEDLMDVITALKMPEHRHPDDARAVTGSVAYDELIKEIVIGTLQRGGIN